MEPLVLPITELMRGVLSVTGGGLIGLALIVVGYLGALYGHRWRHDSAGLALAEDEPLQPGPSRSNEESTTRGADRPAEIPVAQKVAGKVATIRWALRGLGLAGVCFAGSLLVIEAYGAEPILNWSFGKLEAQSGIKLTFSKATGGLLSGKLFLRQVHVVRENHAESNFDLTCSEMTVRFSVWKILFEQLGFQELWIDQISGSYHRLGRAPEDSPPKPKRPARNIPIGHLQLNDVTIDFTDDTVEGEPVKFALAVKSLDCASFRTAYAPYDVIFRSDVAGTIDQHPFSVQTANTSLGPKTEWRATGLPINLASSYLGGPFRWLRSGTCDVQVVQQLRETPHGPVTLDTHLVLRNVQPGVPGDTKPAIAIAAQLLLTKMKKLPKEKELKFTLNLDPDKFDLTKTEGTDHLWQQFKAAAVASLFQTTGVNVDGLPDAAQQKLDNAVDNVANKALQALEKIRDRRKEKKAEKAKQPEPKP